MPFFFFERDKALGFSVGEIDEKRIDVVVKQIVEL
jgi:hypothetical protein